jgi:hypothetical protein
MRATGDRFVVAGSPHRNPAVSSSSRRATSMFCNVFTARMKSAI